LSRLDIEDLRATMPSGEREMLIVLA